MPALSEQIGEIRRPDVTLSYYTVTPQDPRAVLIIVHGLSEHRGRYRKLQRELASEGFATWAYDQRGFGKSTGRRTYMADYHDLLEDLNVVTDRARQAHPKLPLVLIGHSLGGVVVATFCIYHPNVAAGMILSAPAYDFVPLPPMVHFLGIIANHIIPTLSIPYPSDAEKLSHDPEIGRAFRADPLVQKAGTPRFYHEFRRMNGYLKQHAHQITRPTLILQGTDDMIVFPEGAKTLYGKIRSKNKRLIAYNGFYHEPFNEIGRERVIADVVGWTNELISS